MRTLKRSEILDSADYVPKSGDVVIDDIPKPHINEKRERLIALMEKYLAAKEKYKMIGMVNTNGKTPKEQAALSADFSLALNEMAQCRQEINRELLSD